MSSGESQAPAFDTSVVRVPEWRPRSEIEAKSPSNLWGGLARKP
jgi:hypothetical protein